MEYVIGEEHAGKTLKTYLRYVLGISSAMTTRLKQLPLGLCVNGEHVTVRYLLKAGDVLSVSAEDKESSEHIVATKMDLDILFEDDDILVLNKPPYVPTHPSHGHFDDTVANGLAYLFEERGQPFVFRACSRLDRDTSGVVTIAKNAVAAHHLHRSHLESTPQKVYLAILRGTLVPTEGTICGCIRRKEDSVITRVLTEDDGDPSLTRYRVLAYGQDHLGMPLTLAAAEPVTGRTHQLRVHFSSRGCPILGDFLYGTEGDGGIGRQALHCCMTSFPHPTSGQPAAFFAPIPSDMAVFLRFFPNMNEERIKDYVKNQGTAVLDTL